MIGARFAALKESRPHELLLRFLFGGTCTALAALIANRYGPSIGGLFLAFPAIFPAASSLIQAHEARRKKEAGLDGMERGRLAAGLDASGTAMGCTGLMAFAAVVWRLLPGRNPFVVIGAATVVWFVVSASVWRLRRTHFWRKRSHA
jgi:hypothetical protein